MKTYPQYLLAYFSEGSDDEDPCLRFITEKGMGAVEAHRGKWFTYDEVMAQKDKDYFIILIPRSVVECGSFT